MSAVDPAALVREDVTRVLAGRAETPVPVLKALDPLRGARLVVTGGAGILGSWLLELLAALNRDHGFGLRATVIGRSFHLFRAEKPHLAADPSFAFVEADVRAALSLPEETTHIVHAAAITNGNDCASVPTLAASVNTAGVTHVCDAARLLPNLQKIVLLGSGLVYGKQSFGEPPVAETHAGFPGLFDAKMVYAASKRFAEMIAASYVSEAKLPVTVARPFAFVGPYQPLRLPWAVTDFIRDALHGGPIRIMGDGTTVRSLMYLPDFALAVLLLAVKGRTREAYNIGGSEAIDLLSLARKTAALFPSAPRIETGLGQANHPPTILVPDTAKAERDLGFRPVFGLDEALARTVAWHRAAGR